MKIIACLAVLLTSLSATLTLAGEFYVAPNGNDGNPGTKEQPFATLAHARDAVRQTAVKGKEPVDVIVRGGTYFLPETLVFGSEDSGTKDCPITYKAYSGERVVLSGGRQISGWKPYRDQIRQCDLKSLGLDSLSFDELYDNGRRQPLARVPNVDPKHPRRGGFLYPFEKEESRSKTRLSYDSAKLDPSRWSHPDLAVVQVYPYHNWIKNRIRAAKIDNAGHIIELEKPANYVLGYDTRFYVENVFEELDAPGEWYLDRQLGTLYFWPPDDKLAESDVVVPALDSVIQFQGDAEHKVQYVSIVGFDIQACRQTAVTVHAAEYCTVAKSTIINAGGGGVTVDGACRNVQVLGNDVTDTGSEAVGVSGQENLVSNNYIHHIGVSRVASAISISGQHNTIAHNLIHDLPALGITFAANGADNTIEYNDIHHFGMETNLGGGIYSHTNTRMETVSNRITIRFNRISDCIGWGMDKPGEWRANPGWGIWLDDMIDDTVVYGNILVRNVFGGIQLHGGKNNVIENNIMGAGIPSTVNHIRKGTEPCDNKILRNIIYYTNAHPLLARQFGWSVRNMAQEAPSFAAAPIFLCGWSTPSSAVAESDYNLFYPVQGDAAQALVFFRGASDLFPNLRDDKPVEDRFAWWRKLGYDAHSLEGDPLFVDVANDDFRLKPDSPALKLGFKPLPLDQIGLYADPNRASWPVNNHQNIQREELQLESK